MPELPIRWRPKGWKPYDWSGRAFTRPDAPGILLNQNVQFGYEAGADAMLDALKRMGEYVDASKTPYGYVFNKIATYSRDFKGYFVLIPDEDKQNST